MSLPSWSEKLFDIELTSTDLHHAPGHNDALRGIHTQPQSARSSRLVTLTNDAINWERTLRGDVPATEVRAGGPGPRILYDGAVLQEKETCDDLPIRVLRPYVD